MGASQPDIIVITRREQSHRGESPDREAFTWPPISLLLPSVWAKLWVWWCRGLLDVRLPVEPPARRFLKKKNGIVRVDADLAAFAMHTARQSVFPFQSVASYEGR